MSIITVRVVRTNIIITNTIMGTNITTTITITRSMT